MFGLKIFEIDFEIEILIIFIYISPFGLCPGPQETGPKSVALHAPFM